MPRQLLIASRNHKKLQELHTLLAPLPLELVSLDAFPDSPEVVEDGATFLANAIKKATESARRSGLLTLADDSGLVVPALGGAPGVVSSRFAGPEKDDLANCHKLLSAMRHLSGDARKAYFQCVIAVAEPDRLIGTVEGTCHGLIVHAMRGTRDFGYDPLFLDPASQQTFAELEPDQKHAISHRGRALAQARALLEDYITSS